METFKKLISNPFIQFLGPTGIIVVITWIVTHLAKLPIWEIWLAILFTIGCAFWIINQLHTWQDKHKKGLSNYSDKEIENTIREWVDTPFLSFKREDVPNVYFQFVVTNSGVPVTLIRSYKEPHAIGIVTDVILTLRDQEIQITEDLWRKVNGSVCIEMARLGIQFEFNGKKHPMESIRLIEPVYLNDALTSLYFIERIMFVFRAVVLVQEVTKEIFRERALISHKTGSQD